VHYLGIDRAAFAPRDTALRDRQLVAIVARLTPVKGVRIALEAMRLVRERVPGARMDILGDGPERPMLEEVVSQDRLPVRFLGSGDHQAVRALFDRSRVLCCPSVLLAGGTAEGFGLAAIEASATGLPVVATRAGGLSEAVVDGTNGLLVAPGDATALASALVRLLTEDALHAKLSSGGPAFVAQKFDVATNTRALAGLYESVMANSGL
jgi:glycosyltransferase involved in cell wall biosynthesis